MSRKRRNTSSAEPDSPPPAKSQLVEYATDVGTGQLSEQPRTGNGSAATAAFPGLGNADELFYGPAQDGIDYLRMVRTEAKRIPHLLTASLARTDDDQHGGQNYDGFFDSDEAYVAIRSPSNASNCGIEREQQLYHTSILTRLDRLRSILQQTPPLNAIRGLPKSMPISFPASSKTATDTWRAYMTAHVPNPVQMACMDSSSVMELIKMVTKNLQRFLQSSAEEDVQRFGAWVWSILGKCPDKGQLGSEEISDLRACAKAADTAWRWLHNSRQSVTIDAQPEVEEGGTSCDVRAALDNAAQAEASHDARVLVSPTDSLMQRTHDGEQIQNQKRQMILEMIITVVGETYGQRDLLELRRSWTTVGMG